MANNKETKSGNAELDKMHERHQQIWKALLTHPKLPSRPYGVASIGAISWCDEKGIVRINVHLVSMAMGTDPAYVIYGNSAHPDQTLITYNVEQAVDWIVHLLQSPGLGLFSAKLFE